MTDHDYKVTKAQYTGANKAARDFHKAEHAKTEGVLTDLVSDAIAFATSLVTIRLAIHADALRNDVKAKAPNPESFIATMRGAETQGSLEYSVADVRFAFALPCDATTRLPSRDLTIKSLARYVNRQRRTIDDDGQKQNKRPVRWEGFKSFVQSEASYASANSDAAKYDANGNLTPDAKVKADKAADKRTERAATFIAQRFDQAATNAFPNEPVKALASILCQLHDMETAKSTLAQGMTDSQVKDAMSLARDELAQAVARAKVSTLTTTTA